MTEEMIRFCELRHKPIDDAIKDIRKSVFWIFTTAILILTGIVSNVFVTLIDRRDSKPVPVQVTIDRNILKDASQ